MARIGVTGPKGRVGTELVKRGCIPLDCDVTNLLSIKESLKKNPVDVLINCSAKSDVDGCEKDSIGTYLVNAFAPRGLIDNFSGKFVQLSTDFIFSGEDGPYDENAEAKPQSVYGFSKYFGEVGLRKFTDALIIRTTNLYDCGPKQNFVLWVLNALKQKQYIKVTTELSGNPTYVPHLVDGILKAIEKDITGILNISGKEVYNRYDFAMHVAWEFGLDPKFIAKTKNTMGFIAKRPRLGGFILDKADKLEIPIYTTMNGLENFKHDLK